MDAVTISPKFQVVIPRRIREKMNLHPGEKLQVISFDNRIELVQMKLMRQTKGFLKGYDATFRRDEKDRA